MAARQAEQHVERKWKEVPVVWIGRDKKVFEARMATKSFQAVHELTAGVFIHADPCFPKTCLDTSNNRHRIVAQDLRFQFSDDLWKTQQWGQAASVGSMVSHRRAWEQLSCLAPGKWGVVIEQDIEPREEIREMLIEVGKFLWIDSGEQSTHVINMASHLSGTHAELTGSQHQVHRPALRRDDGTRNHWFALHAVAATVRNNGSIRCHHQTYGVKFYLISARIRESLRSWRIPRVQFELALFEEVIKRQAAETYDENAWINTENARKSVLMALPPLAVDKRDYTDQYVGSGRMRTDAGMIEGKQFVALQYETHLSAAERLPWLAFALEAAGCFNLALMVFWPSNRGVSADFESSFVTPVMPHGRDSGTFVRVVPSTNASFFSGQKNSPRCVHLFHAEVLNNHAALREYLQERVAHTTWEHFSGFNPASFWSLGTWPIESFGARQPSAELNARMHYFMSNSSLVSEMLHRQPPMLFIVPSETWMQNSMRNEAWKRGSQSMPSDAAAPTSPGEKIIQKVRTIVTDFRSRRFKILLLDLSGVFQNALGQSRRDEPHIRTAVSQGHLIDLLSETQASLVHNAPSSSQEDAAQTQNRPSHAEVRDLTVAFVLALIDRHPLQIEGFEAEPQREFFEEYKNIRHGFALEVQASHAERSQYVLSRQSQARSCGAQPKKKPRVTKHTAETHDLPQAKSRSALTSGARVQIDRFVNKMKAMGPRVQPNQRLPPALAQIIESIPDDVVVDINTYVNSSLQDARSACKLTLAHLGQWAKLQSGLEPFKTRYLDQRMTGNPPKKPWSFLAAILYERVNPLRANQGENVLEISAQGAQVRMTTTAMTPDEASRAFLESGPTD